MKQLQSLRIVWFAILLSTIGFAAVAVVLPSPHLRRAPAAMLPFAFGVVALGVAVMSFVLPATVLRQNLQRQPPPVVGDAIRMDDQLFASLFPQLQTRVILAVAMSQSVSLFGLMLNRVGFDLSRSAPFFVVGTLLIAARFPTRQAFCAAVERALGVRVVDVPPAT